jgi:ribosomal protein S18 acetylase RimI-like enzyme
VAGVTGTAPDAAVVLRAGTDADAGAAARLHAEMITEGFLAGLGPRFLAHLYRRVARGPESFLVVAESDGRVAGFLAGSVDLGALYRRFLLRDGLVAAASALPRLLYAWPRVWETLRHGAGGASSTPGGSELLAVAVDPAWRGRHVGALLVERFLSESARRGVGAARVVVGADNVAAIALYHRAGFRPAQTFELHRGTPSLLMSRPAPTASDGRPPTTAGTT